MMVVLRLPLVSFVTWQLKPAYEGIQLFLGVLSELRCVAPAASTDAAFSSVDGASKNCGVQLHRLSVSL